MSQFADNLSRTDRSAGPSNRPGRCTRHALVRATPVLLSGMLVLLAVVWTSPPLLLQAAPDETSNGATGITLQAPSFDQSSSSHSSATSSVSITPSLTITPALNHGHRSESTMESRWGPSTSRRSFSTASHQTVSQSRAIAGGAPESSFSRTNGVQPGDHVKVVSAQSEWSPADAIVQRSGGNMSRVLPKADPPPQEEIRTAGPRRGELQFRESTADSLPSRVRGSYPDPTDDDLRRSSAHTDRPLQRLQSDSIPYERPATPTYLPQTSAAAPDPAVTTVAAPPLNFSPPPHAVPQSEPYAAVPVSAPPQVPPTPYPAFRIPPGTVPGQFDPLQPAGPGTAPPGRAVPDQDVPTAPIPDSHVPPIPMAPTPQVPAPGVTPILPTPFYQPQPSGSEYPVAPPGITVPPQHSVGQYGHSFMDQDFQHDTFANDVNLDAGLSLSEFPSGFPGHVLPSGPAVSQAFPGTSGYRATVESDAPGWLSPYNQRAQSADPGQTLAGITNLPGVPMHFVPWWDREVRQSTGLSSNVVPVDVSMLLQDAMRFSPQVIAIQAEPEVQYRVITQEAAKFDWTAFLEAKYDDLNDPVGNELTTGNNSDRLLVNKFRNAAGIRGRNLLGGEFRMAQEIGTERQNSRFFIPNNQGQSRLELSYRQPLLDGAGRTYNESEIILARIQANSSEDEVVRALQEHLIEITEAYWTLYRARAEFFQRQKLLTAAKHVLERLEARTQVDTIPRQVLRAKAAVARSQTRIQRTLARVKDAEAQLRLLVNSPAMLNGGSTELLPLEPPNLITESADLQSVLQTSLTNRPDISEAIRKMRASSVRLGVSRQELLPRLDFLVESYVADLSGNRNLGDALQGQFGNNRPGYTVGLEFEIPLENRAAIAKNEQRQWELKRSINVFRATVEKSLTDVEIARREVATAWSEVNSHYHALLAANQESEYLMDRFTVLPATEDSATLLLEDLLDSIERVADEESSFVQAQVDHAISLVKLKKEMGILLQSRHARPTIQSPDQQWLDDRLQSAVAPTARMAPEPKSQLTSPPTDQQRISTASLINPQALVRRSHSSDRRVRPAAATQSPRPLTSQDPLRGIPVADHPTSWSRPGFIAAPE